MKVIDFHCDTLSVIRSMQSRGIRVDFENNNLHIDIRKLTKGDYLLQCFAAFIDLKNESDPLAAVLEQADLLRQITEQYPEYISQVRSWKDVENNRKNGRISALLTIEEGGCCKGNLALLRTLYELGARIMTLTWNHENELAFPNTVPSVLSSADTCESNMEKGLKEKGFEFITEMERLGIIIDVSHLSDAGFWDVANNTTKPFIASHSNARTVCGHCRNLTDDMIRTIADRGGIIGLNYYGAFLEEEKSTKSRVSAIVKHAKHIINIGGIDVLGLGSDFDGISGELEMYDASCLPMLENELRHQGFAETDIEKIFYKNAQRLLQEVLS